MYFNQYLSHFMFYLLVDSFFTVNQICYDIPLFLFQATDPFVN